MLSTLSKVRGFVARHKIFCAALALWLVADCLDIISTEFGMAFVKGAMEANPLVRDPNTLKFMVWPAVIVKGAFLLFAGLPTAIAGLSTESEMGEALGVIPMCYLSFQTFLAVVNNVLMLWKGF